MMGDRNVTLPILDEVLGMFRKLDEEGGSKLGAQALIKVYEE